MIRNLVASTFALLATAGFASSALACESSTLKFHDITIAADGTVSRSVYVPRDSDGQRKSGGLLRYSRVVRDSVKLENFDELTLNALPKAVDQTYKIKVRREAQEGDAGGIISTTYKITEIGISSFGGVIQPAVENTYYARVKSNYLGNGDYSRACGEVTKMEIDFPIDH